MVLPPIDESMEDKLILLKAARQEMPLPTETPEQKAAFWEALMAELPAFVDWLLQWQIPQAIRAPRFGVAHYHNPELLQAMEDLAADTKLLALIDLWKYPPTDAGRWADWAGTAEQLQSELSGIFPSETRTLLTFSTACAVYLAKLAKHRPDRVKDERTRATRNWRILPPPIGE